MGKSASDLEKNPMFVDSGEPTPPVNKLLKNLLTTGGKKLELLTRTNRHIVSAIDCGGVYVWRFKSAYIAGRIEQLERLSVSAGGKGREELIRAVQAGGDLPDGYYAGGSGSRATDYAISED